MKEYKKEYNIEKSINGQAEYCKKNKLPHFAPNNGNCWNCGSNIYSEHTRELRDKIYSTGISVKEARESLVTGCPHCNRSYVD